MTRTQRALFYVLRLLDDLFPGWSAPRQPPADHVSQETLQRALLREWRNGVNS